jgi:hypothetical protein
VLVDVNWPVLATIAAPILALFIGAALDRFLERKPRLVAYFAHTSVFRLPGPPPLQVHTHGIVIRNTGRKPATDVRVSHAVFPNNFNVFPDVEFEVKALPGGGTDLVFPTLIPGQQLSISYMYFPPLLYSQIHSGIRHKDGFATEITVLPTPQYPPWVLRGLRALVLMGLISVCYILYLLARAAVAIAG